jgi:aspergillopepsin I
MKFNGTLPSALDTAASQSGEVAATPEQYDSEYLCPVAIGTPAQTLNLDFDTGSADLWVFSSSLSSTLKQGHSVYTASSSSSFKTLSGYSWSITYGDGSGASGTVGTDTVNVGGVTVTSQAVEAATSISSSFQSDTQNDGLLGLSFSSINTVSPTAQKTFFDNAKSSLAAPVFTADLKPGTAGTYDFGYIDSSKYTGGLSYISVDSSNGFWGFNAAAAGGSSTSSIADTGTTLLLIQDAAVTAYYAKVSSATYDNTQGGYVFPCGTSLPAFTSTLGGSFAATVPGSLLSYAPVGDGSNNCFGAIQSSSGIGFDIYGDIIFKSYFTVFDGGNLRLGFASKS